MIERDAIYLEHNLHDTLDNYCTVSSDDLYTLMCVYGVPLGTSSFTGAVLNDYVKDYEAVLITHHDTHLRGHKLTSKTHFSAHGR